MQFDNFALQDEQIGRAIKRALASMRPETQRVPVGSNGRTSILTVERVGVGPISTPRGNFVVVPFQVNDRWKEYVALVNAPVMGEGWKFSWSASKPVVMRFDSGCVADQVLDDVSCDCKAQLHDAMQVVGDADQGLVIHIRHQDGWGHGVGHVLAQRSLQEQLGISAVEAAELLLPHGFSDERTYDGALAVAKFLGVTTEFRVALATNNPLKIKALREEGYRVDRRELVAPITRENRQYLAAQQEFLGHSLGLRVAPRDSGSQ